MSSGCQVFLQLQFFSYIYIFFEKKRQMTNEVVLFSFFLFGFFCLYLYLSVLVSFSIALINANEPFHHSIYFCKKLLIKLIMNLYTVTFDDSTWEKQYHEHLRHTTLSVCSCLWLKIHFLIFKKKMFWNISWFFIDWFFQKNILIIVGEHDVRQFKSKQAE